VPVHHFQRLLGVVLIHAVVSREHQEGLVVGKLHYDGSLNPRLPGIGGPCVAEIVKTETLYSGLLYGIGQRRLDRFADKPLSLASLCSAYPHLVNPQQMVATRTYPSRRTDNLPFFGPSAHGSFLLLNYPNFSTKEKHFLTLMMPQFLKRFLRGL